MSALPQTAPIYWNFYTTFPNTATIDAINIESLLVNRVIDLEKRIEALESKKTLKKRKTK